jgi:hypothetical protein
MKNSREILLKWGLLAVIILTFSAFNFVKDKKDKESKLDIQQVSQKLELAVELRKFADAKDLVGKIIPWMKQDIKDGKKKLSQIGKSIDESTINKKEFADKLKKKSKLYESTKHLVETSPAAIRVKGKDLVKLVNEYATLVE